MSDALSNALTTDIRKLLTTFREQTGSFSFTYYTKCWKDANFSMIHYCTTLPEKRKALLKKAYDITLGLLVASPHIDVFVFVVYTLYSLFITQLCEPKMLIEVDKKTWTLLVKLHRAAVDSNLFDVDFVFHKLVYSYPFEKARPALPRTTTTSTPNTPPQQQQQQRQENASPINPENPENPENPGNTENPEMEEIKRKQQGCFWFVSAAPERPMNKRHRGESAGDQASRVDKAGHIPRSIWTEAHDKKLLQGMEWWADSLRSLDAETRAYVEAKSKVQQARPDRRLELASMFFIDDLVDLQIQYQETRAKRLADLARRPANSDPQPPPSSNYPARPPKRNAAATTTTSSRNSNQTQRQRQNKHTQNMDSGSENNSTSASRRSSGGRVFRQGRPSAAARREMGLEGVRTVSIKRILGEPGWEVDEIIMQERRRMRQEAEAEERRRQQEQEASETQDALPRLGGERMDMPDIGGVSLPPSTPVSSSQMSDSESGSYSNFADNELASGGVSSGGGAAGWRGAKRRAGPLDADRIIERIQKRQLKEVHRELFDEDSASDEDGSENGSNEGGGGSGSEDDLVEKRGDSDGDGSVGGGQGDVENLGNVRGTRGEGGAGEGDSQRSKLSENEDMESVGSGSEGNAGKKGVGVWGGGKDGGSESGSESDVESVGDD